MDAENSNNGTPLSFRENVVLTIKVLAGAGLVGALIWAVEVWTAAK